MEEGSIQIRAPSPLPDDVLRHIPTQNPATFRQWLIKLSFLSNSTTFINKLPVGLLVEIMQDVLDLHNEGQAATSRRSRQLSVICRHWYIVAVSSPSLWTNVSVMMPLPLLGTYLHRSRSADLSLDTIQGGGRGGEEALVQALSPHLDRVAHMVTWSTQPYLSRTLLRLSSLHIKAYGGGETLPLICVRGKQYPRLKSLNVESFCGAEQEPRVAVEGTLPSLKSLTLSSVSFSTWNAMLSVLENCPALQCLSLARIVVGGPGTGSSIHRQVVLNELQNLTLRNFGGSTSTSLLVAHLSLPRVTKITINSLVSSESDYVIYNAARKVKLAHLANIPIAHSILSHLSHLPALAAVDMVHSVVNDHGVEVRATAPETPRAKALALTYVYENQFRYHLVVINFKKTQEQLMRTLSEAFPSSVRTLRMHVENVRSGHYGLGCKLEDIRLTKAWDTLHAAFPALEELHLTGPYLGLFRHIFLDTDAASSRKYEMQPVWPGLKHMHLEYTNGTFQPGEDESATFMSLVTTMMTKRLASAGKLQRLDVTSHTRRPDNASTYLARLRGTTEALTYTVSGDLGGFSRLA